MSTRTPDRFVVHKASARRADKKLCEGPRSKRTGRSSTSNDQHHLSHCRTNLRRGWSKLWTAMVCAVDWRDDYHNGRRHGIWLVGSPAVFGDHLWRNGDTAIPH